MVADEKKMLDKWAKVVSDANWQKGEIIAAWCEGRPNPHAACEEFAYGVGGITTEHTRRLLRTHLKYHKVRREYPALRWPHFFATFDWHDADEWLARANAEKWSVSEMRSRRFAGLGL